MIAYGFFPGGDPRDFHPDPEASTEAERVKHKADCDAWDRGERPNVNANAPHYVDGINPMHIVPNGYGLGSYSYDDDEDELPAELQPHEPRDGCDCDACYEAGVLVRFREATHAPNAPVRVTDVSILPGEAGYLAESPSDDYCGDVGIEAAGCPICTRPPKHDGPHAAHVGRGRMIARWPQVASGADMCGADDR